MNYADVTGDTPAIAALHLADDEMMERAEEIKPSVKLNDVIPRLSSDATSIEERQG